MESTKQLPGAFELFKPSTDAFLRNIWTFLGLTFLPILFIIPFVFMFGLSSVFLNDPANVDTSSLALNTASIIFGLLMFVVALIYTLVIGPALIVTQLTSVRDEKIGIIDAIKKGLPHKWRFFGASLLVGLITIVGFIFFIIPGFIMLRRYFLTSYFLIDQNLGAMEAMEKSVQTTKTNTGAIWGVILVTILLGLPSIIPVFGQLVATILGLLYTCAPAFRYIQMSAVTDHGDAHQPIASN